MMFDRKTYLANVLIRDRCRNDHFLGVWGTHFKSFVDWANSKPFIRAFPVCKQLVTAGEVPVVGRVQLTGEVRKGMEVMDANLKREQEAGVGLVDRGTTFGIHRNFYLLTAIKRYHQVHHTWPLHIISQFFTPHPTIDQYPTPPIHSLTRLRESFQGIHHVHTVFWSLKHKRESTKVLKANHCTHSTGLAPFYIVNSYMEYLMGGAKGVVCIIEWVWWEECASWINGGGAHWDWLPHSHD